MGGRRPLATIVPQCPNLGRLIRVAGDIVNEIVDLQARIAFQEATIDELNAAVAQHASALDRLRSELAELREMVRELSGPSNVDSSPNERPPHY